MSPLRRLFRSLRTRSSTGQPGVQDHDGLQPDSSVEFHLDPNTAALSEGAPPAGAGGRVQPRGTSPDPRQPRGPAEGDVNNLPG